MFKFRKLMNAADKGGPGAAPDLATVLAELSKAVIDIKTTLTAMPSQITEATSKATHAALTRRDRAAAEAAAKAAANKPAADDPDEDDEDDPAVAKPPAPNQPQPVQQDPAAAKALREAKRARAELDKMKAQLAEQEAATAKERREIQAREDRAALQAALGTKVRPELLDSAVALLSGRLARPEGAAAAVWREGDDELSLDEGVSKWLATPGGKAHLPPAAGSGSGGKDRGPQLDGKGQRVYTDADLGRGLMDIGR